MAIRNKDGTPYKLRSPNALMKNQQTWGDFTVHNMNWNPTIHSDDTGVSKVETDFQVRDSFVDELEKSAPPAA